MESIPGDRYDLRGVSASKHEVHQAIKSLDKGLYPNAFCKILPDIVNGDPAFANLMHADTAGTKTVLAYLYWKETGDLSVWTDIVQDALVMNLDDMACVGVTDQIILSSTIGRNKNLIPGEVLETLIKGSISFIEKMHKWGIQLVLAGGETADVGDVVRTVDVGFTTFARIHRNKLIVNNIKPGDVIIGIASYGQSSYEDKYNSGIGSNGLTMARHELLAPHYNHYSESFDPLIPQNLRYNGRWKLTDQIQFDKQEYTIKQLLLSPTRTYLPLLHVLLPEFRSAIHGVIHNSGGGLTKVLKFIQDVRIVKNNLLPVPPVFQLIQQNGVSMREMLKVFNMGQRLEIYVEPVMADQLIKSINKFDLSAQIIGYVESARHPEVSVKLEDETFNYVD